MWPRPEAGVRAAIRVMLGEGGIVGGAVIVGWGFEWVDWGWGIGVVVREREREKEEEELELEVEGRKGGM